ncbi:hypothetical protein ACPOM7_02225 [Peribacillus castrilensis]|uniref:hypothetical protein n=1 Tax=Peribacillus TaxID=2675229 RepID=UPI0030F55F31
MDRNFGMRLSGSLFVVLALFMMIQSIAFGSEQPSSSSRKDTPFPTQAPSNRMSLNALYDGNIGNDFVQAQVGSDGRFNAGLRALEGEDDWFNLIYSWPSSPGTSFTTLQVDGADLIYGNQPDGRFIQTPTNNEENTSNESVWKTGDISVKQVLQAGNNPATGQPDALQIRYIITNTGNENREVGLRMMLDTMVDRNDRAPFKVPGANGVESVDVERDYRGEEVPAFWQAFNNFDNPDISAQYSMGGRDASTPDRFTIANWGRINGTKWGYNILPGSGTGDSAVGMWWNPKTLAPGEQKIITTYYGRPGVGGEEALVLSGRQKLTYDEWSSAPFNVISYFTNSTSSPLNNVTLKIETDSGVSLVDTETEQSLGAVQSGATTQSTWKLKPNRQGKHKITVKAFVDGSDEPFASTEYEVEALEPVIPPNITLGGSYGTSVDGTPIAGRTSPLTVNASFDNPKAIGVTLIATDADGDRYENDMDSTNTVDWKHTFTPSEEGLWETPMTIKVIPRYEDATTGQAQEFPIILIDPSGFIYNEEKGTDWKLPGAKVVLQYFDPQIQTWVNMSEEAYPGMMSPITNPQTTGNDGKYAWDAAAGKYRVVVSRPGFETTTSREVVVPPPVTDLNVALEPTDDVKPTITSDGVTEGRTYTDPVRITFSSSDNEAGVRYVSYKVDGKEAVKANGDSDSLPAVNSPGQHTIILTSVDHAGNEAIKEIKFEIINPEPAEEMLPLATAAIDKSNSAQTSIRAALDKIKLSKEDLNKAITANAEEKAKIASLKELLAAYNGTNIPSSQLQVIRNYVKTAEEQNAIAKTKLEQALATDSLATAKARIDDALRANGLSLNSVTFVKSNLVAYRAGAELVDAATAAINKSNSTQTGIKDASDKTKGIQEDVNKAVTTNNEAIVKITRLKDQLSAYNGTKIPSSQLQVIRNYVKTAEEQNVIAKTKLEQALASDSLSTTKGRINEALSANGLSLNSVTFVKSNLIAYRVK